MLEILKIKDFIIAKDIEIEFGENFNVFTGETGAGKTLLINAVRFGMGEDINKDLFSKTDNKPVVQLIFNEKNKETIFKRIMTDTGKTRAYIDDIIVPLREYRDICSKLISIHGQRNSEDLFMKKKQIFYYDYFFKNETGLLVEEIIKLKREYTELKRNILNSEELKKERTREIDYLKFQIEEIDNAHLSAGEEESLKEEKDILTNSQKIIETLSEIETLLIKENSEDKGIIKDIGTIINLINNIRLFDKNLNEIATSTEEINSIIKDTARSIVDEKQKILNLYNENRLDEITERISLISSLKRKYGDSIEKILITVDEAKSKLKQLEGLELDETEIIKKYINIENQLKEKLPILSKRRLDLKDIFNKRIEDQLKDLALEKAGFSVIFKNEIETSESDNNILINDKFYRLFENGIDSVDFLISTNPGQPELPISNIVSGGELSRIMLAIKTILKDIDDIPTLIFDEIDEGIGGKVGDMIGGKLSEISKKRQTICITHLPQIASRADSHYLIEKKFEIDDTEIIVKKIEYNDRVREISRMIGGEHTSDISLKHAEEILKKID